MRTGKGREGELRSFVISMLLALSLSSAATADSIQVQTEVPDFGSSTWTLEGDFRSLPQDPLPCRVVRIVHDGIVDISDMNLQVINSIEITDTYRVPRLFSGLRTDGSPAQKSLHFPSDNARIISRICDGSRTIFEIAMDVFQKQENGELWLHTDMLLEYEVEAALQTNPTFSSPNPIFERLIESERESKITRENLISSSTEPSGYLIITSNDLAPAFSPLARWKQQLGYDTKIITIDSIYNYYGGIDEPEQIRTFLAEAYEDGVRWVLLGGDEFIVPVRYAFHLNRAENVPIENQQICDLYYADLTGDWDTDGDGLYGEPNQDAPDIVPEIMVGRVPVRDSAGAAHFVEKSIRYERMQIDNPGDFASNVLMAASDQMRDYSDVGQDSLVSEGLPEHLSIDRETLAEYPSGLDPSPTNPFADDFVTKMSEGHNLTYLLAHGQVDGFTSNSANYNQWPKSMVFTRDEAPAGHGSLNDLTNFDRFGIVYSVGCNNGAFDMDTLPFEYEYPCVAERMLADSARGAVALVSYSRWGWVACSYYLTIDFNDYLFNTDNRLAPANNYSKLNNSFIRDLVYGLNIYGDPSLRVWTGEPATLNIDGLPDHADIGENSLSIQLRSNDQPVSEALVTVVGDSGILVSALTDESGNAVLEFTFSSDTNAVITASKPGHIPAVSVLEPTIALDADDEDVPSLPTISLNQNFPNPFNPTTTVTFVLRSRSHTRLTVYNILGQQIYLALDDNLTAGSHSVSLDGTDWPSGVYFYRLEAEGISEVRKMVLLK